MSNLKLPDWNDYGVVDDLRELFPRLLEANRSGGETTIPRLDHIEMIDDRDVCKFAKCTQRGGGATVLWLSRVAFDDSHTHAMLYTEFYWAMLAGGGEIEMYEKRSGGWARISRYSMWQS